VQRNISPSSTVAAAFAYHAQHHLRFCDWGVKRRPKVAKVYFSSSKFYTALSSMLLIQKTGSIPQLKIPGFRAFASTNENNGEESWESDSDEDNNDLDDSFVSTLDDNSSYDGDDNDDDSIDPFDYGRDVNQSEEVVAAIDESDSDLSETLKAEYNRWSSAVDKAILALEKKLFSLEKEFLKAEQLETLQTRGQYLQSYRYMFTNEVQSVTVQDWDTGEDVILTLDSNYDSIGDEIDAIFTETKKMKRGKKVVGTLMEQTVKAIDSMKGMKSDLDAALQPSIDAIEISTIDSHLLRSIQGRLMASAQTTNFKPPVTRSNEENKTSGNENSSKKSSHASKPMLGTPSSNIRRVISPAGCTILVGRNRRGNEYLSLNLAKKKDIWMHARDIPGAHVLVLQRRGGIFATDECLQLAADLAAFYSDGRTERRVPVSAAEPKHIQKPRGAPLGAVKIREELRVYNGRPDAVPDKFKEARAVSGLSDEYRIKDKSKLRKQNQQQAVEQRQAMKRKIKEKSEKQEQEEVDKFY
jgi:predicted ribosome quality control (RQC) complex YloA/Tae2 family protein